MTEIDAVDALIENGSVHPRGLSWAAIIWVFLAIAALALGAGFALIPDAAAHVQL